MEFILKSKLKVKQKIKVLGNGSSNGINLEYFNPNCVKEDDLEKLRKDFKINKGDFVYIFIGRIVKNKGVEELVQAFKKLSEEFDNVKLVVLGSFEAKLDPISTGTKQLIQNYDKIIFTGYQEDIRPFLKISHVLVHPSYREGFPNVVMQGGTFNLPCIVSDINGCNVIIQNRVSGLLVPPKNLDILFEKMKYIMNKPDVFGKLKLKSRKLIEEKFDQSYIWNEILKRYKKEWNV
jgi:glycosyltransferase involved in cell wall biosynthesis